MAHPRSRAVLARRQYIASLSVGTGNGTAAAQPIVGANYTPADLAKLQTNLVGSVLAPGTPSYDAGRMLADTAYNPWPILIV